MSEIVWLCVGVREGVREKRWWRCIFGVLFVMNGNELFVCLWFEILLVEKYGWEFRVGRRNCFIEVMIMVEVDE